MAGRPARGPRASEPAAGGAGRRPREGVVRWRRAAVVPGRQLILDFDATITIAHSEKENAAATWKRTFGMHPLLCYLDRPATGGGEALAGLLRAGNAGSNTAGDHIAVLELALAALPVPVHPGNRQRIRLLARSDSAGASHAFAAALRERGLEFSLGFAVDERVQAAVLALAEHGWAPAVEADGTERDGAWVAEITDLVDLSSWPPGSRLIVRKEHPHPGAQLRFTDADGCRITAFLTDTTGWGCPTWSCATASTPASKTGSAAARTPGSATCRCLGSTPTPAGSSSRSLPPI